MKIAFQADANLDLAILRGLRRREPAIDFREAGGAIPDGAPDADVLALCADQGRVLITGDVRTMGRHLEDFVSKGDSPGVILVPSSRPIGAVIEGLLLVWLNWSPDDVRNQIRWLPSVRD